MSFVTNSKLYQTYKQAFKKAHPYDDFEYELQAALEPIASGLGKPQQKWRKLHTFNLADAFGWRESPQGVEYWKKVEANL